MITIREALANGTDPADIIDAGHLDDILCDVACTPLAERAERAFGARHDINFPHQIPMADGSTRTYPSPSVAAHLEWEIELLEDPELLHQTLERTRIREQVIAAIEANLFRD